MAYTTKADVKTYLNISDADDDTLIDDLILAATARFEKETGRTFEAAADSTRYFHARKDVDGRILRLNKELCQITTVTNGDGTVVTSSQYTTWPKNETSYWKVILLASSGLYWTYSTDPEDAISVEGRWAYSLTPPKDVVHAVKLLTAALFKQRDMVPGMDQPIVTARGTVLLPPSTPKLVADTILSYRRWV